MLCAEHAAEFRPHEKELAELGVRLVFVSTGRPDQAEHFKKRMKLLSDVWTDPKRETYRHLGFKHGYRSSYGPRAIANYARALSKGWLSRLAEGDVLQQGGVLVVARGGAPVYGYASAEAGDMPPTEEVLDAARKAARS